MARELAIRPFEVKRFVKVVRLLAIQATLSQNSKVSIFACWPREVEVNLVVIGVLEPWELLGREHSQYWTDFDLPSGVDLSGEFVRQVSVEELGDSQSYLRDAAGILDSEAVISWTLGSLNSQDRH